MNSPNELSFLPDDYLEQKAQRRTNIICSVMFLIVVVAIGAAFSSRQRSIRDIEKIHASLEQDCNIAARQIEQVQQMQEKQRTMARQAELTASLIEKVPRSALLADITNALPARTSLVDFSLDAKRRLPTPAPKTTNAFEQKKTEPDAKSSVPEPQVFDVTVKITGMCDTDLQVAQFMNKLSRSRFLKDVNLVITDVFQYADEKLRKFQIEAAVNPDAEAAAPTTRPNPAFTAELDPH